MFRSFSFFALIIENNPMDMGLGMGGWREQVQLKLKTLLCAKCWDAM